MLNSVYEEKLYPKINDIIKTNRVDTTENKITVRNFDKINSFLLNPSIKFCFKVP